MRNRIIFALSALGILAGLFAAYMFGIERKPQPPAFAPVSNPYATAIYANGIIEGEQPGGSNLVVYPEVAGVVTRVLVHEGQAVKSGTPLLALDDSVQRATTEQLRLQAQAARSLLDELIAQPRRETLAIAEAQVVQAEANLQTLRNQYAKRRASHELDPNSVSRDVLDSAEDAARQAATALDVARRQLELTRAGAWRYDIENQRRQAQALEQAWHAAEALLAKYTLRAGSDGVVLSINAATGTSVSTQGAFDAYSQGFVPVAVMSAPQDHLAVRCYVDEILVARLPAPGRIQAQMSIRGTVTRVPLEFVRVQPYVSPKLELSNQRQEKVDLRVLPVIFRFAPSASMAVYPGQLVDVYIGQK
jgi:HlyD family secretion protein